MIFEDTGVIDAKTKQAWKAVEGTLGLTGRIIGMVDAHWDFYALKYVGEGTRQQAYGLFDEVLCGMLLQEEGLSGERLRELLGLSDDLGQKAFAGMLHDLVPSMIVGDDSYYCLSEKGIEYARMGSKFEEFSKNFELTQDVQVPSDLSALRTLATLGSQPITTRLEPDEAEAVIELGMTHNLGIQQQFALKQATEVHLPEKGFYLDSTKLLHVDRQRFSFRVALIEDFHDEEVRFKALHATNPEFLAEITRYLNSDELKAYTDALLEKFLDQAPTALTEAAKPESQAEDEEWLVAREAEIAAIADATQEKKLKAAAEAARKNFTTMAFEDELDAMVRTCREEVWLISPWIRENAFSAREKQIRSMLENGCKVFVAFSAPHRTGEDMVAPIALRQLDRLGQQFDGFYAAELPQFHEKIVLALHSPELKYEYTGSFNVLSLHARNKARVGRENMRRLKWGADSDKNYQYYCDAFAAAYLEELEGFAQGLEAPEALGAERKIEDADKSLAQKVRKISPLVHKAGEEGLADFQKIQSTANATIASARSRWVNEGLQKLGEQIESAETITEKQRQKFEKELAAWSNKWGGLAEEGLPEILTDIILRKYLKSESEKLLADLEKHAGDLNPTEKKRLEARGSKIRAETPVDAANLVAEMGKVDTLIREKSIIKGLKVKGKMDVKTLNQRNRKKSKQKNKRK